MHELKKNHGLLFIAWLLLVLVMVFQINFTLLNHLYYQRAPLDQKQKRLFTPDRCKKYTYIYIAYNVSTDTAFDMYEGRLREEAPYKASV